MKSKNPESPVNHECLVDLGRIHHNIETLKSYVGMSTRMMVIIKAAAYGTDDVRMAQFLSDCGIDIIGLAFVDEAIDLKRQGICLECFVLNAAPYEFEKVVAYDLTIAVSSLEEIQGLSQEAKRQGKQIKAHLHVNTGMGRFGCQPKDSIKLAQCIDASDSLILDGLMTHFSSADDPIEDPFTLNQIETFEHVHHSLLSEGLSPRWIHAQASNGAIRFPMPFCNMVRIGIAIYGFMDSPASEGLLPLKPAITLKTRIVGINALERGDSISYGRIYRVQKDRETIAVLPLGYFDGLRRIYSEQGHVIIRGHIAPMVGQICMDFMMVDVTEIPDVQVGDQALVFGEDQEGHVINPEVLARRSGTITRELLTSLGPRIQRVFIDNEGIQQSLEAIKRKGCS